jgi:uncharacterized RDD family membrane protein YckC
MEVASEKYRTFEPRFVAGLLDGLVFVPLVALDLYFSSPGRSRLVLIAWAVLVRSAPWIYSVALHTLYGQTLGKRATGVKVLDVSETRLPSLGQSLLRDIGDIIPTAVGLAYFIYFVATQSYTHGAGELSGLPGQIIRYSGLAWFLLEIITMFTNSKRRAFHDLIAGTVVVNLSK